MRPSSRSTARPDLLLRAAVCGLLPALVACADTDATAPADADVNSAVSAEDRALEAAGGRTLARAGAAQVLRATGDLTAASAQFRALLGEPLNPNTAGEKPAGRREINWDAVPAAVTNTDAFPADFFNTNSPRGAVITSGGSGLRVSDTNFADVNPSYALLGGFRAFSPAKTFAPVGGTTMDVQFRVAGSTTPARVAGFGVVFAGADRSRASKLEFYDAGGTLLLTVLAPRRVDEKGHSFAGALFDAGVVARVRITSGQAPLGPTTGDVGQLRGQSDLVVLDDFLYSEPRPAK
jgi:hypothetical protein